MAQSSPLCLIITEYLSLRGVTPYGIMPTPILISLTHIDPEGVLFFFTVPP
jgi:hypothetical protein